MSCHQAAERNRSSMLANKAKFDFMETTVTYQNALRKFKIILNSGNVCCCVFQLIWSSRLLSESFSCLNIAHSTTVLDLGCSENRLLRKIFGSCVKQNEAHQTA